MESTTAIKAANDGQLVEFILGGDAEAADEAFEELFRRHSPRLQHYLTRRGLVRAEREDVANEAWCRAWKGLDQYEYRDEKGFFAWLRTIADNVIYEYNRQRYFVRPSKRPDPEILDTLPDVPASEQALISVTREEMRATIPEIAQQAPNENWRLVIEALLIDDGWTAADMAEFTGLTVNNVYVIKHRALQWLRTQLIERFGVNDIDAWLYNL